MCKWYSAAGTNVLEGPDRAQSGTSIVPQVMLSPNARDGAHDDPCARLDAKVNLSAPCLACLADLIDA